MSLRPTPEALFAAAREDEPNEETRERLFRDITLAAGVGAAAAVAPTASLGAAAKAATASIGTKLVVVAGLIGIGVTTLGVALSSMTDARDGARGSSSTSAPRAAHVPAAAHGARLFPASRQRDPAMDDRGAVADDAAARSPRATASAIALPASALAEEARLVTAARAALLAGDPSRALALVYATHKLSPRAMEPEELVLEARALRALGRTDEAAATDLRLRSRHPDHALAR